MEFNVIKKTPLYRAFSELGKRIYLPEGIFFWSRRAKKEAELNGTIGTAYAYEKDFIDGGASEWIPCYLESLKDYFKNLDINDLVPYATIAGIKELRETWKTWIIEKSLLDIKSENYKINWLKKYITLPTITSGITNALYLSCALFLDPGEIIISPNKRWGNYDNIIEKFIGAKIKSFEYFKGKKVNIQGLKEAIDDVSKLQNKISIILNFPNNPTGYIPTWEEGQELLDLLKERQKSLEKSFVILVDDAYEPYIFSDGVLNRSFFYDLQQIDQDIIPLKLDGITKELLLYGGRIGFVTLGLKPTWVKNDEELEELKNQIHNKLEGINRSTISNCNMFYQAVTQKIFINEGISKLIKMRNKVKEVLKYRYEKINSELMKIEDPSITIDPNYGGFFVFVNLDPKKVNANKFADYLLTKYKVGVIPIEKDEEQINGIRIAYSSIDIKKIPETVNRIKLALKDF